VINANSHIASHPPTTTILVWKWWMKLTFLTQRTYTFHITARSSALFVVSCSTHSAINIYIFIYIYEIYNTTVYISLTYMSNHPKKRYNNHCLFRHSNAMYLHTPIYIYIIYIYIPHHTHYIYGIYIYNMIYSDTLYIHTPLST
jgi:hypothetical protein